MNVDQIEFNRLKEYLNYYKNNFDKSLKYKDGFLYINFKIEESSITIAHSKDKLILIKNKNKTIIKTEKISSQNQDMINVFFEEKNNFENIKDPQEILKTVFGYDNFRNNQEKIIDSILSNNDTLALMPTGGGKSICYQIPALCLEGVAIIISPLISLMQDQVSALKELGINAEYLNSSLEKEDFTRIMRNIQKIKLLYVSPEKYNSKNFQDTLDSLNISFFAIDEAHCVSKWGHDFRPDYIKLSSIKKKFNKPIIALTATADLNTRKDIPVRLGMKNQNIFVSSFDRPNIEIQVQEKSSYKTQLLDFVKDFKDESGIVYCLSRKKVEQVTEFLKSKNFNAYSYHAGLSPSEREKNQNIFIHKENIIIVATVAFGMGIDKSNVRYVVHCDLPNSIESYYQEIGRAGRDGEEAKSLLIYGMQDFVLRSQMIFNGDSIKKMQNIGKLNEMLAFAETSSCKRNYIMDYFGNEKVSCGKCSSCLDKTKLKNVTEVCYDIISLIKDTNQIYGISYIVDLIKGSKSKKVKEEHKSLKSYNSHSLSDQEIKKIMRQLIVKNILKIDLESGYNSIQISNYLKEEIFIKPVTLSKKSKSKSKSNKKEIVIKDENQQLYENLKKFRYHLAKKNNIPPYLILQDKSLRELAEVNPSSKEELPDLYGWGAKKIEKYGQKFIDFLKSQ